MSDSSYLFGGMEIRRTRVEDFISHCLLQANVKTNSVIRQRRAGQTAVSGILSSQIAETGDQGQTLLATVCK